MKNCPIEQNYFYKLSNNIVDKVFFVVVLLVSDIGGTSGQQEETDMGEIQLLSASCHVWKILFNRILEK